MLSALGVRWTGEGVRVSMTPSSRMADMGVGGLATAAILVSWRSGVEAVFVSRVAKPKRDRSDGADGCGVMVRWAVGLVKKLAVVPWWPPEGAEESKKSRLAETFCRIYRRGI